MNYCYELSTLNMFALLYFFIVSQEMFPIRLESIESFGSTVKGTIRPNEKSIRRNLWVGSYRGVRNIVKSTRFNRFGIFYQDGIESIIRGVNLRETQLSTGLSCAKS